MNTQKPTPHTTSGVVTAEDVRAEWSFQRDEPLLGEGPTAAEINAAVGARIKQARGPLTQGSLAKAIGVHVNTVSRAERGEAMPDAYMLIALGAATKTSPAWLLMGEPYEMHSAAPVPHVLDAPDLVLVRGYGVEASTGNGSPVNDEQVIGRFAFKRTWLARKGLNPDTLAVVTARGDSMEPTVRDGDILLVDRNVTRISTDGMYLIERDNELYCKRLQSLFDGGAAIMSDNSRYAPEHLSGSAAEALRVTGRVIWIGGER